MSNGLLLPPLSQVIQFEGKGNFAVKKYYKWPFSLFYRKKLKMILDMMDDRIYTSILDFGSGPAEVFKKTLKSISKIVICADTYSDIPNKKFDLIVCASVLEFVDNIDKVLCKLNENLLPGQAIVGASPMDTILSRFYFRLIGDKQSRNPHEMILNSLYRNFFLVRTKKWFGLYFSFKAYKK